MSSVNKDPSQADMEPYKVLWLDSAYQQTLLPDAPWHKIEDRISEVLAQRVEKQFLKPERKEALLQLLGKDFTDRFIPSARWNPTCLEPPAMSVAEKHKIMSEAQAYLNSQMYKAAKDVGYQNMLAGGNQASNVPPDYSKFLQHTYKIFKTGLDRELYRQEQELTKDKKHKMNLEKKYLKLQKIPAPSRLKPAPSALSSSNSGSTLKLASGFLRANAQKIEADPPPLWGPQSDEIGKSILAVLQKDPRKFEHVAGRLHGRQLPGSLRAYMWSDVLFKNERKRLKEVVVEKVVRERFAKAISRGIQELKINRATSSPINGLIENAVIETYNKTTSLVPFKTTDHMKEAIRTLNTLYVYDRSYEPYLIHWLFPLQIAFQTQQAGKTEEKGENVLELAMYLDLLNSNCYPNWPTVFSIAERVLNTIRQADPDLYNHLKMISRKEVKVNPKDFLVQLLHGEKSKAEALMQMTPGGEREQEMSAQLLADPLVFIRRWIGEGFVSILDTPSVMYVWDQCFLQLWSNTVIENVCVALLELLRHKFMEARNYTDMKDVFLYQACKLYTVDIQHAWIHLESHKDPADIPYLNRQRPTTPSSRMSAVSRGSFQSVEAAQQLSPCGLKDIKLHMIIPSEIMQREPWLAHVDPNALKLNIAAYFGEVKLQMHNSIMPSNVISATQDSYGNTIYDVVYPEDKFIFRDIDLSPYDLEREMGAYPYAIVRVEYHAAGPASADKPPIPVGWSRIPLFHKHAGHGATSATFDLKWDLQAGEHMFDLHPGDIPETLIATQPLTPSEYGHTDDSTVLGYNSKLTVMVYDLREEPSGKYVPSLPSQVPPTDTREPSPAPRHTPTPVVATPQPPVDDKPWVKHQPAAAKSNPAPTGLKGGIDLYVDGVRFIPDDASCIKVTGRIIRTGSIGNIEDILALPDLNSGARSPMFKYRFPINLEGKEADPGMLAFLRVYTYDPIEERLKVIGGCLVPFFDNRKKLLVGGHQVRLHSGVPSLNKPGGITAVKATDLDSVPSMPGVSLLVRILPHSEQMVPSPAYSTGYYISASCEPNPSEMRIFQSYGEHMAYPKTVRDMILRIMENEGLPPQGQSERDMLDWLETKLDMRVHLTPGRPASHLSLVRCVRYKIKNGLRVRINQMFGFQDGLYVQCFARVAPGSKVLTLGRSKEGYGGEEKFVTLKHDFESLQQAQKWLDKETELHPYYDVYSCLIIQLFGLEVLYHPKPDHNQPGTVTDLKGHELTLEDEGRIIGWAALPLFEGNSALIGTHHIPVFRGKPSAEILQQLTSNTIEQVLRQPNASRDKYNNASLTVTLWDGHFDFGDLPDVPVYEYLLETVGSLEEYRKARNPPASGKTINNFVLDTLEAKYKKQGTKGAVFVKEKEFFQTLIEKTFYDLMENALMTAGYGPL